LLKKLDRKMAEKRAKYDLADFVENWKKLLFWKSHISVKVFVFCIKIWLQRFFNMGYRMDILRFKFEFWPCYVNSGWAGGPSINYVFLSLSWGHWNIAVFE
jgi:hypothetical protein